MSKRTQIYHFARLNLLGQYPEEKTEKRRYIWEAMTADVVVSKGKFKYMLARIDEITFGDDVYVFGQLVKYKHILEGEIVDEDAKQILEGGLPQGVVAKSNFFLHYASSIVSYRQIANRISDRQFRSIFAELLELGKDKLFIQVRLETIDEEIKIRKAFDSLDKIYKVTISVHPSNPTNRNVWRKLDERLQNLQAKQLREVIEGGEMGLNKEALKQEDVYGGVIMAADGYGSASIVGEKDNRPVTIKTGDSPVTEKVAVTEDSPSEILKQLVRVFKKLVDRLK